jgi:enoyl-CoA hydratase
VAEDEVLFEQRGKLGLITLNRPKALNALTWHMVKLMDAQLDAWASDDSIAVVAIQGAGDKAFAAGGDIRWLYDNGQGGQTGERNFQFFADEYRLNTKIKTYPKPYVAIMDGIVMGGGVGVSIHGSHRFITERTMFAMPETGIGLFPDVGATYFLPRMQGAIGMFCGLTGARLKGSDAVLHLDAKPVRSGDLAQLLDWLAAEGSWQSLDQAFDRAEDAEQEEILRNPELSKDGPVESHHIAIDEAFDLGSVEEIIAALKDLKTDWAEKQLKILLGKSPTSTRIAFRQIRDGAKLDFEDCMRLEYRLARYCMTHPDFYEGVRATILDKDGAPNWSPASLVEATDDFVAEAFAHLGDDELDLP